MQCTSCTSPNVQNLAHFWQSLPGESPLRGRYAPPASVDGSLMLPVLAVLGGIALMAFGEWFGLLVTLAGAAWLLGVRRSVAEYEDALAKWSSMRICLTCVSQF